MGVRWVVAAATGWCYRIARRAHLSTSASRQELLQRSRPARAAPQLARAGSASAPLLRVVLLGNGPVESYGVAQGTAGLPEYLAETLAARTRRAVEIKTVIGAAWDLPTLGAALREEQQRGLDVLVVSAAYRPQLAEIPLRRWWAYAEALRAVLVDSVADGTVVRVLSLPWREAARAAPLQWGGLFGNRVIVVAETAESTLRPDQQALPLRLHPPLSNREWIGPAFSAATYLRWADQVAAEPARALRP